MERRADRALRLLVDGEPRVLHVELCFTLRADVPDMIFQYVGFVFAALRREARGGAVPPIESVVVVLSGRRRPLPKLGVRRTGWPGRAFSGTHFRIDAVYQRTVAELRARGSLLWLVFAPLARDATPEAMRQVVKDLHAGALDQKERDDLFSALLVMASIDPWGHPLGREIRMIIAMLDEEEEDEAENEAMRRVPILGEMIIEAEKKAFEAAVTKLLGRLFARRVGRQPTRGEKRTLVRRAEALGPTQVEDALLDLDRDALLRWLADPPKQATAAKPRRRAAAAPTP